MDLGYLDYTVVAYIDLIITILIMGVISLFVIFWKADSAKLGIIAFIVGTFLTCFVAASLYQHNLDVAGNLFNYKIAIETGADNGFTKRYYEIDSQQRANLNKELQGLNVAEGKLAIKYGFGATDTERQYLKLYIDSMIGLYLTPLLLPLLVIGGGCGIAYFWDRGNRILSVDKQQLMDDVRNLRKKADQIEQEIEELNRKKSELDPDTINREHEIQKNLIAENKELDSKNEMLRKANKALETKNKQLDDEKKQRETAVNYLNRKLYRESTPKGKEETTSNKPKINSNEPNPFLTRG